MKQCVQSRTICIDPGSQGDTTYNNLRLNMSSHKWGSSPIIEFRNKSHRHLNRGIFTVTGFSICNIALPHICVSTSGKCENINKVHFPLILLNLEYGTSQVACDLTLSFLVGMEAVPEAFVECYVQSSFWAVPMKHVRYEGIQLVIFCVQVTNVDVHLMDCHVNGILIPISSRYFVVPVDIYTIDGTHNIGRIWVVSFHCSNQILQPGLQPID